MVFGTETQIGFWIQGKTCVHRIVGIRHEIEMHVGGVNTCVKRHILRFDGDSTGDKNEERKG